MRLLHPFMPFISEEIWQQLPYNKEEALVVAAWPQPNEGHTFPEEAADMAVLQEVARAIRNLRSQVQLPPGKKTEVIVRAGGRVAICLDQERHHLSKLTSAEPLTIQQEAVRPKQALTAIITEGIEVYLPLEGVIDLEAETARLEKELNQVQAEIKKTEGKLNNPSFVDKAPDEVVAKEKLRREEQESRLTKLRQRLQELR